MKKKQILYELYKEPRRRPYGAKVNFLLNEEVEIKIDGEVSLLVLDDVIITLKLPSKQPSAPNNYLKKYELSIEGFRTASEAEEKGFNITIALLWASISRRFSMRLDYDKTLPYTVYDRTLHTGGISGSISGSVRTKTDTKEWAELLNEALSITTTIDSNLLLSMEIFSSANLETTERTKFLSLVSSLEPLASQNEYPNSIKMLIDNFQRELQNLDIFEMLTENEKIKLKNSLKGRLDQLKKESIRQSLLRTIRELLPSENDAVQIIDDAYNLRSKILHEGTTDPYLSSRNKEVTKIIRKLFAARIGKQLKF